jgi:hypothetical protein
LSQANAPDTQNYAVIDIVSVARQVDEENQQIVKLSEYIRLFDEVSKVLSNTDNMPTSEEVRIQVPNSVLNRFKITPQNVGHLLKRMEVLFTERMWHMHYSLNNDQSIEIRIRYEPHDTTAYMYTSLTTVIYDNIQKRLISEDYKREQIRNEVSKIMRSVFSEKKSE